MNNNIFLDKISNIEKNIDEINKKLKFIIDEFSDNQKSQILLMAKIENIADFIKNQYNVVIEEKENFDVNNKNYGN